MMSSLVVLIERLAKGGWLNNLLTIIAGASLIGAFAPFSIWYLIFPGLVWLILPLQSMELKPALLRSFWFNIGFYGAGITWVHVSIHEFGHAPLPLSIPLTGGLVLLFSVLATAPIYVLNRFFSEFDKRLYFLVALPFSWIVFEWIGSWFFTGFPWLNLGHSQVDGGLSSLAPLMGSSAISLLIVFIAGLLALTILEGTGALKITLPTSLLIILSLFILHRVEWVQVTDRTLSVSMIQPSISQDQKWLPEVRRATLDYFNQTTDTLDSQLVVWPEGAVPALAHQVRSYLGLVNRKALNKSQAVLTGIPVQKGDEHFNAAMMLGSGEGTYYKQHLVPFGEYVPLESLLRGLIQLFDLPMSTFSSGPAEQPPLTIGEWKLAMAICYEIIFKDVVATQLADADILVTLSNDAWFNDSFGSYQHLQIARMRALENGVPMIRGTNDGISALVDHKGQILAKMNKFEKGVLEGEIRAVEGVTPYRQLGPFWSYMILILVPGLILLFASRFKTSS